MCEFKQLYVGEDGYVVRCMDCTYLQCAFGSTVLTLSEEDFRTLRYVAHARLLEAGEGAAGDVKQYWLPTAHAGVNMLFTRRELRRFYHMLEHADTEMTVGAMVALFEEV